MQFITRLLIVLAVLGGLGYGSYAFGKYVLSARLFGPQSANTVTAASTDPLQASPGVDVEVLPAPQPTPQGDDSGGVSPNESAQPTATPDARIEIVPSQNDNDNDGGSSATRPTRSRAEPTPRPRRRRRTRPTPRPTSPPRTRSSAPIVQAPPARTQNIDPPASSSDSSDNIPTRNGEEAPRVETPTRSNPVPVPTRRRERRTIPDAAPRDTTPNVEAPRPRPTRPAPVRRRENVPASPIPVPEGAQRGGGESPIPVPG